MNNVEDFKKQLPECCWFIEIQPRHKVELEHARTDDGHIWVVLLTTMPGDCCKAWKLTKGEYWQIQPKHGTRDRYIRENMTPTLTGTMNPPKPQQASLLF